MPDSNPTQSKETKKKYAVVFSYDLKTPPGLHDKFIELMENEGWKFKRGGKKLPQTTCFASFQEGGTSDGAIAAAHADVDKVEAELKKADAGFKVERRYAIAFPEADSRIDFQSTTKD
jgi:hypothetical protein